MSLRNRVRVLAIVSTVLWLVVSVWFLPSGRFGSGWVLASAFLTVVIGLGLANFIVRRSLARFQQALAREDIPAARQEFSVLVDFWRRRGREIIKSNGIAILVLEGRYREALAEYQALDVKRLGTKSGPVITNQMAWCAAQLGEPARAIEVAQSVLPRLENFGPEYSSSGHLVLGTANFLLGKASEAVPHLKEAYASTTVSASRKAAAAYYLGESYSAMGDAAKARLAYQSAVEALPNGTYGKRALERLE